MCALPLLCDSPWDLKEELSCSLRQLASFIQRQSQSSITADDTELLLRCAIFHSVLLQRQTYKYSAQGIIYNWWENQPTYWILQLLLRCCPIAKWFWTIIWMSHPFRVKLNMAWIYVSVLVHSSNGRNVKMNSSWCLLDSVRCFCIEGVRKTCWRWWMHTFALLVSAVIQLRLCSTSQVRQR